ncbi:MAG: two-component system chemotaxis family response regulator CheB, partial [Halothiobacillaceae bacterium]
GAELVAKIKMAAKANVKPLTTSPVADVNVAPKLSADAVLEKSSVLRPFKTTDKIIAVGASTGGTEAIKEFLQGLPADSPGVVITQHIPEAFSGPFARRMDKHSAMTVCEAEDGQHILPGHVYIAPGHSHLLVKRDGARYVCRLNNGAAVNRHKPAVDVLFRSVAQSAGANALGVILTGMGDDGAMGMKEMHDVGAHTIAQDEQSSVVWGMPGEAVKQGGVDEILPLTKIAQRVIKLVQNL